MEDKIFRIFLCCLNNINISDSAAIRRDKEPIFTEPG